MKIFKEAFCERFACPPESYLWEVLTRSLYPRARPFARFLYWCRPAAMFTLLEDAAQTRSEDELRDLISEYEYQTQLHGRLLARRFKIRVSGQRLLNLHAEARKIRPRPAPNPE